MITLTERPDISTPARQSDIAIIGIGCWYPGARNPRELWENILARRQQFRRIPDGRLPLRDYYNQDRGVPDKTYGAMAAVIDGFTFDWAARRIPKSTYEATDITHWLALEVVLQMLANAGYDLVSLPRQSTQVVVGNTLTGEFTRSNFLRLRWPFVARMLHATAEQIGLAPDVLRQLTAKLEVNFKSVFPSVTEDTLAGGLSNTIAGRISNYLNVHGGGFSVDGACSSSLLAVYVAASNLADGTSDFAIAGGVDISLDPFELVGFAKTGALTPDAMSVYDKRGNGFIPGEGCGFVGMKRLADARRDGDYVYAVLDGYGISSDGKGGLTAPSVQGQSMALCRAYDKAGIKPNSVDFIEGHGTGTAVGDRTELLAIAEALAAGGSDRTKKCGVTSVKSIIGHTKAAAGVGALIKTVIAVNQRIIPPTAGCATPHDLFANKARKLQPVLRGERCHGPVRAGVSAMGFGGINVHATLSSGDRPVETLRPPAGERVAMASAQDSELICLAAESAAKLRHRIAELRLDAVGASLAELADLAASANREASASLAFRAAIVTVSPLDLVSKLDQLDQAMTKYESGSTLVSDRNAGIFGGVGHTKCRFGFVFPGQGSQRVNMGRALVERYDWAQDLLCRADQWAAELGGEPLSSALYPDLEGTDQLNEAEHHSNRLKATERAQPAIVLSSILWLKYLALLGIRSDSWCGHSLGELTAFYAAGAFDEKILLQSAVPARTADGKTERR